MDDRKHEEFYHPSQNPPQNHFEDPIHLSKLKLEELISDNERLLLELRKRLDRSHDQTKELFESSGITPKKLQQFFKEPHRFDAQTWQLIQSQREKIETLIGDVIEQREKKKSRPRSALTGRRGHWIFVR